MSASAQAARAAMFAQVAAGAGSAPCLSPSLSSTQSVLCRGCDPVMAARSQAFLPPLLGGASVSAYSDDTAFFAALERVRSGADPLPSAVLFAPGAHRWAAAGQPIPGGIPGLSHGWGLAQYHARVRQAVGDGVPIVGSAQEADIVPLLRKALGLQ
jgi:hypothetical protein